MKKNKMLWVIFAVIFAVHAAVLFFFVGTPPPRGRQNDVNPSKQAPIPAKEEETDPVKEKAAVPEEKKAESVQKTETSATKTETSVELYRMIRARKKLGKPFDYTHAVRGDIPVLAECVNCSAGLLVDLDTRTVLWAKNPERSVPIASMTKVMTELVAYETILESKGKITLETPVKVTVAAHKIGGSQVYLDPRETFPLGDLLKAAAIKSANDAAYLIAEFIGNGDVDSFVRMMNRKAVSLNMTKTRFHNPHGLPGGTPSEDNIASPEDMVKLAEACLIHPQLMQWASTWSAPFRTPGTKQYILMTNHNHLVPGSRNHAAGVDGLKTGFINRAGYCLVVTCKRNGRRVVGVVMGCPSYRERDRFVTNLLNWGYKRIDNPAQALLDDARLPPPKKKAVRKSTVRRKARKKAKK